MSRQEIMRSIDEHFLPLVVISDGRGRGSQGKGVRVSLMTRYHGLRPTSSGERPTLCRSCVTSNICSHCVSNRIDGTSTSISQMKPEEPER